jgi:hypothetical protein
MPSRRKTDPKTVKAQAARLDRRLAQVLTHRINPAEREFIELMRAFLRKEVK